ncbi:hypothetical protein A2960_03150 [Candidatus Gottesmanbacteria bacterium RIFCSPLOWO2_01_FULL_39_12b]|uniref:Uncharacterized protein n=1 Tax=Candidatus Gottesmanbacteria bacterium RIFCSPLOWO2_01_FULL_39_12b TaxID=1798388 RepID=A0A1F6AQZ3_9BACT|nr:MAG: hypothetical protein A2960_03150 [Candidatus Gottesmanbacteria bacterium RIFCSPLOWO2_01_FULL_39_12b]
MSPARGELPPIPILIEHVALRFPDLAGNFMLRRFAFPTAGILRAVLISDQRKVSLTTMLESATGMLERPPVRVKMLERVMEVSSDVLEVAVFDLYGRLVLPRTGIHVVDLCDPFSWDMARASQRLAMIGDIARLTDNEGYDACRAFNRYLVAQEGYITEVTGQFEAEYMKLDTRGRGNVM